MNREKSPVDTKLEPDLEKMDLQRLREATEKLGLTGASIEDKLSKYVEIGAMAETLATQPRESRTDRSTDIFMTNQDELGFIEVLAHQDSELKAALQEQKSDIEQRIKARAVGLIPELSKDVEKN